MNKHNVIELCDYKKNKDKIKKEHECFRMLDTLSYKIKMSQTYAKNFKQYLEIKVKDGNIKQSFATNINCQVEFMFSELKEEVKSANK